MADITLTNDLAEAISENEGVLGHFQADREFNLVHASDSFMESCSELFSVCLSFAGSLSESGGFGGVDRMTFFDKDSKFVIFSLNAKNPAFESPRVFGMKLRSNVDTDKIVSGISKLY